MARGAGYGEQPDNFWRILKYCTCVIEYKPSKYKRADIIRYVTGEDGKMSKVVDKGGGSKEELQETKTLQQAISDSQKEFVPASTIEGAEEFAKRFIKNGFSKTFKNQAVYTGISLDNANEINQTLYALYENLDLPKLNGIKAVSPTSAQGKKAFKDGADAIAAYNPVEQGIFLNKDILKSAKAYEKHQKEAADAWDMVMGNIDKLSGSQKELALTYQKAGRDLVDGSLGGAITHEVGHHVQWQTLDAATNNAIGGRMKEFAPKISGYANASKGEYLAESFSAYAKGERDILDPKFVEVLDEKRLAKTDADDIITVGKKNLVQHGDKAIPATNSQSIREWYVANVSDIPNQIDKRKSLEEQARQAFDLRSKYKREARAAMEDKEAVEVLEKFRPIKSFDELLQDKISRKKLSKQEALKDILKTASETNKDVNKKFGL